MRSRLDVAISRSAEEVADGIPIALDGLELWSIGDRLLREVMAGQDAEAVMTAEHLRGTLPPGLLGTRALTEVVVESQKLLTRTAELRVGTARTVDVDVDLGGGRRLTGTVSGIYGTRLVTLGYSKLKAKQRLLTWIDLLALAAGRPDESWTAHAVGKDRAGPKRALSGPLDHRAVEHLRTLVELRDLGLCSPLPAPIGTGLAWAEAHAAELRGDDRSPAKAAAREWETDPNNSYGIEGENALPAHVRVYGPGAPISTLVDAGLGDFAWQIWEPLVTGGERVSAL